MKSNGYAVDHFSGGSWENLHCGSADIGGSRRNVLENRSRDQPVGELLDSFFFMRCTGRRQGLMLCLVVNLRDLPVGLLGMDVNSIRLR